MMSLALRLVYSSDEFQAMNLRRSNFVVQGYVIAAVGTKLYVWKDARLKYASSNFCF